VGYHDIGQKKQVDQVLDAEDGWLKRLMCYCVVGHAYIYVNPLAINGNWNA